eukprot:1031575-Rhodomonas_salina.1
MGCQVPVRGYRPTKCAQVREQHSGTRTVPHTAGRGVLTCDVCGGVAACKVLQWRCGSSCVFLQGPYFVPPLQIQDLAT